jgi:hypothetical protein
MNHQITPHQGKEGLLKAPAKCQRVSSVVVRSPMTMTTGSSSLPKLCRKVRGSSGRRPRCANHQITPRWREEGLLDLPAEGQRGLLVMVRLPMTVTTGSSSLPKLLYVGMGIEWQETQECESSNHSTSERRGTLRFAGRRPTRFVGHGAFTNDHDDRVL